jgi:hypothetical protein
MSWFSDTFESIKHYSFDHIINNYLFDASVVFHAIHSFFTPNTLGFAAAETVNLSTTALNLHHAIPAAASAFANSAIVASNTEFLVKKTQAGVNKIFDHHKYDGITELASTPIYMAANIAATEGGNIQNFAYAFPMLVGKLYFYGGCASALNSLGCPEYCAKVISASFTYAASKAILTAAFENKFDPIDLLKELGFGALNAAIGNLESLEEYGFPKDSVFAHSFLADATADAIETFLREDGLDIIFKAQLFEPKDSEIEDLIAELHQASENFGVLEEQAEEDKEQEYHEHFQLPITDDLNIIMGIHDHEHLREEISLPLVELEYVTQELL